VTTPAIVWIVIGLVTTLAVVAMVIALVRHFILLGRTLSRFQEEVTPIAGEITAGGDRASTRMSKLQAPPGGSRGA
jgi:hypothetical protein